MTESGQNGASPNPWNGELTRGVLPLLVLRTLRDAPSYRYAIGATLAHHGIRGVRIQSEFDTVLAHVHEAGGDAELSLGDPVSYAAALVPTVAALR